MLARVMVHLSEKGLGEAYRIQYAGTPTVGYQKCLVDRSSGRRLLESERRRSHGAEDGAPR